MPRPQPAYMTAATTPANASPSAMAADIDTKAIASTPMRPARKSRIIEASRPKSTGSVPAVQIHRGGSPFSADRATSPKASAVGAIAIKTLPRGSLRQHRGH